MKCAVWQLVNRAFFLPSFYCAPNYHIFASTCSSIDPCNQSPNAFTNPFFLLDAPVFIKKPKDVHAYSDSNALFECFANGIPKPDITWRRNGDMIENSDFNTVGYGFLLVKMLVLSDMGPYQCFAENSLGKIQATAELAVYMRGKYSQSKLKGLRLVMRAIGCIATPPSAQSSQTLPQSWQRLLAQLVLGYFL